MATRILDLERQLSDQLPDFKLAGGPSRALVTAARGWSEAIWAEAEARGPAKLDAGLIEEGLALARRPVFVCGVHRSGTTLVRDLLDGHPAVTVLPSEGTFFTNFEAALQRLPPDRRLHVFGQEWLRRLANPINQPPYWVLGRSTENASPYVAFAQGLMGWWSLCAERMGNEIAQWPLVAVVLAYASQTHDVGLGIGLKHWVEKTPTNEQFIDRLLRECPDAKIVHVVRHPAAVFASRKRIEERADGVFRSTQSLLQDLAYSYRLAADSRSIAEGHYLLVRYEELTRHPQDVVGQLAAFLGIEVLPILFRPTVATQPATANSSFGSSGARGRIFSDDESSRANVLSTWDRDRLAASVGDLARSLGYEVDASVPWRARMLRLLGAGR